MTKIWAMRGYSGSGKSTRAREIATVNKAVVINRDYLRKMMLGEWWTGKKQDEDRITTAEEALVLAHLKSGTSVVIDATHLWPKYLRKWARLATQLGVEFEVVDVKRDVQSCVDRDILRSYDGERSVGEEVIRKQAKSWSQDRWPEITAEPFIIRPVGTISQLPPAIIVDIDGTLAHIPVNGRSPYDYTRVKEDKVDKEIAWLVSVLHQWRYVSDDDQAPEVIVMSGRDDTCRADTVEWMNQNDIPFDQLIMRPADAKDDRGNKLPDYQVKYQLFNDQIRDKYKVLFVLDDRQQVVDMWRKLGLKCLQVAEGNF
ncbi:polynucleotide kinase [Mycobacterium phage SirDuracell]|uniref:Polynucleotide kinase n=5 Tax=Viruses TaxID=10239 RepID=B5A649_9CAUD|nr:polynucleotide kinase [Mycobacterium phage Porky]YP_008531167.1 polynucleotide kinase [Mycobacterium phage Quink]YP_008857579.1 polynucleotide kinase [Mycobacterium phage PhatBacter]YP_008858370.1 polynucleotide kinase [Mycobacterium phage Nala]YP_009608018.1 polynucleotide kinase [Mycobacterium phage SirDuracell]AEL21830.1 polynucleotide kinase [Mycobacterium phage Elph10]AKU42527.1 polynucleotide kinase [Mycobacterium phage NoSleep]AOY11942.1 polynucleotide kinase [Mycobacterium phage G